MAAAVALMARDRKRPKLSFQLLIYPTVAPAKGTTFESYETNGYDYMTTKASMEWFYEHYLADPADASNPYAVPLLAEDFRGLPPAHVLTAEYDPLHDEGVAYARKLADAGVPTTTSEYAGAIHGFIWMSGVIDLGRSALNDLGRVLREAHGAKV
jgi:acetyl esterase